MSITTTTQTNGRPAVTAERARTIRPPRGFDAVDVTVLSIAGLLMCCECSALVPNTPKAVRKHRDNLHLALDHPIREDT